MKNFRNLQTFSEKLSKTRRSKHLRWVVYPFQGTLIPCITFVQTGIVQLANFAELVLERHLPVVVLLAFDIVHHRIHMAVAHAERAITVLPTKMMERIAIHLVDPSRRTRFHGAHNLRQIRGLAQEEQYVDVV